MMGLQTPDCVVTGGNGSAGTDFHDVLEDTWRNPIVKIDIGQLKPLQRKIRATPRNGKKVEGRLQSFDVAEGG
jgi:hypothetical protein